MKISYLAVWAFQDGVTRAKFYNSRPEIDDFVFGFGGVFEKTYKDDLGHVSVYKLDYGQYQGTAHIRTVMGPK